MQRLSSMSATELDASKPALESLVAVVDKDKLKNVVLQMLLRNLFLPPVSFPTFAPSSPCFISLRSHPDTSQH